MPWWDIISNIFKGGKEMAEVFVENKEKKGERIHEQKMADIDRDLASLGQFSKEFHARQNRSWWDSFIDGLNRLPRPLIAVAILGFFVLAPFNPERFLAIAKSYEIMPPGYWALLSVVIGFYFGGRMQLKSQDFAIKKDAVTAAKELMELKNEFRQLDDDLESAESKIYDAAIISSDKKIKNRVIEQWLDSRKT